MQLPTLEVINANTTVEKEEESRPLVGGMLPDYDEVVRRYPELEGAACVFLSGSLVSGWGNERSDLDIFVVAEAVRMRDVVPPSVVTIGRHANDPDWNGQVVAMGTLGGYRADIEFWTVEHVEMLLAQNGSPDERYRGRPGSPSFGEQDLLYRLSIGLPLSGEAWLRTAQRRLQESDYATWLAENYKVDGENRLDDLVGMIASGDAESATLMARETFQSAIQAVLALQGDLSPNRKWLHHRLAKAVLTDITADDAWRILTMRDCAEPGWPAAIAELAHRLFLLVEQQIAGHGPCDATANDGVGRRLGVRTYRSRGSTVIADLAKYRTDHVGGYLWSLCDGAHTRPALAACLTRDLGVDDAQATEFVGLFLDELSSRGLIA